MYTLSSLKRLIQPILRAFLAGAGDGAVLLVSQRQPVEGVPETLLRRIYV